MSDFFIGIQVKYILFVSSCSPIVEVEVGFEQVYNFMSISKSYIHVRFVKVHVYTCLGIQDFDCRSK